MIKRLQDFMMLFVRTVIFMIGVMDMMGGFYTAMMSEMPGRAAGSATAPERGTPCSTPHPIQPDSVTMRQRKTHQ